MKLMNQRIFLVMDQNPEDFLRKGEKAIVGCQQRISIPTPTTKYERGSKNLKL
jgi:hypothetical protein